MGTSIEKMLKKVLKKKELTVLFQPIINLQSRTIYGYEGLIRGPVNSPLHAPGQLFDASVRAGFLIELDMLCRQLIIHQFKRLRLDGLLFLNVDPGCLLQENFLKGKTLQFLEEAGLDPARLVIELTEARPIENLDLLLHAMKYYRNMGLKVALDDLGAGYSGLKLWSRIQPDIIKIDKYFVQDVHEDRVKQKFIDTILTNATALTCTVITEGVETEQEYATLRKLGVDFIQGYYFGRPKQVPVKKLSPTLFRKEIRFHEQDNSLSVEGLARESVVIQASASVLDVGELFTSLPDIETIVVLDGEVVLGMVLKKEFMNVYASRYGRALYGKQSVRRFTNQKVLQVDCQLSLEDVSYRLTSALDIYTEEFIILQGTKLLGIGRLIDLLHEITKVRVQRARHANPLTGLPGNVPIQEHLQHMFAQNDSFVVCYFDLDNFKPFNDVFGFSKGDGIIRFLADLLSSSFTGTGDFIGHVGGDDFVVVTQAPDWEDAVRRVLNMFDRDVASFYQGTQISSIRAKDRKGIECLYGIMSLSVGAVIVEHCEGVNFDLSEEAALAKHRAKEHEGSYLYIHHIGQNTESSAVIRAHYAQ